MMARNKDGTTIAAGKSGARGSPDSKHQCGGSFREV